MNVHTGTYLLKNIKKEWHQATKPFLIKTMRRKEDFVNYQ
jgi:hypothetical protein